jgi:hypothetical protein
MMDEINSIFSSKNKMITNNEMNNGQTIQMQYDLIRKIANPYEFIYSKIPNTKTAVSKLSYTSSIFYDLLEIIYTLNIFEWFDEKSIKTLHFTPNFSATIECIEILRENNLDNHKSISNVNANANMNFTHEIEKDKEKDNNSIDFIFYETVNDSNHNNYILELLTILKIIIKSQKKNGTTIIKLSLLFHKPAIDVIYILTSLFEKVYVIKPNTSNITSYEKFIVCKGFILNEKVSLYYSNYYNQINDFLNEHFSSCSSSENTFIKYIIQKDLPCYFTNRIDDINIINGQQQLETTNQVINILKNKNRDIKLENIKKINIQKCIQWCEKYNIPSNKFLEKTNIFLRENNDEEEEV